MSNIIDVIAELKRFSSRVFKPNRPANQDLIAEFESKYKVTLPSDYKYLVLQMDGFKLFWNSVYGLAAVAGEEFLGRVYEREHFEVAVPQFAHLVPFHNDGSGNFYCFDTKKMTADGLSCPVVFWTSNYSYDEKDLPEKVNENFAHWVEEVMIEWSLEEFDYEGNRRS
jgi:hypothetical protein